MSGGCNSLHSEETKAKISAARTGKKRKPFSEEHRNNLAAAKTGKPRPMLYKKIKQYNLNVGIWYYVAISGYNSSTTNYSIDVKK